jgi:hypothetical protein
VSVVEVRELARIVIDAGGDLADLKQLVALGEAPPAENEPDALCSCQKRPRDRRAREWRLRQPGVDVVLTLVSGKAYREAVAREANTPSGQRGVISKGRASGWVFETIALGHGHAWQCSLCHPPAPGLDVETRDTELVLPPSERLRWRPGYGWRCDAEPDGAPLPVDAGPPDERFYRTAARRGGGDGADRLHLQLDRTQGDE